MRQWLAIDVGGSKVTAALVSDAGEVMAEWREPVQGRSNADLAAQLQRAVRDVCQSQRLAPQALAGVGIAIPGTVDRERLLAIGATNLGFRNLDVCAAVREVAAVPVALENDANAGALGEKWFGAGRGINDFAYVCVGTGLGGGLILGGRLYVGATGRAGEVGHIVVDVHGHRCLCGSIGCPEGYVGGGAGLPSLARRLWGEDLARAWQQERELSAQAIYEAAAMGDPRAQMVVAEAGRYHAAVVISLVRALDVSRIIFGGGIAAAGQLFLESVHAGLDALGYRLKTADIVLSPLGGKAGLLGAASVVKEKVADQR